MGQNHDIIEITGTRHRETEKAIFFSDDGVQKNAVWLPKSQIEITETDGGSTVVVDIPEWLADEKGLI